MTTTVPPSWVSACRTRVDTSRRSPRPSRRPCCPSGRNPGSIRPCRGPNPPQSRRRARGQAHSDGDTAEHPAVGGPQQPVQAAMLGGVDDEPVLCGFGLPRRGAPWQLAPLQAGRRRPTSLPRFEPRRPARCGRPPGGSSTSSERPPPCRVRHRRRRRSGSAFPDTSATAPPRPV